MTTEKTVQKNTKRKPIHKQAGPSKDIKKIEPTLKATFICENCLYTLRHNYWTPCSCCNWHNLVNVEFI